MVIFRSSEGKAGYHQAEALDEAVRFVERLRNTEGVEQARIFRLEEVPFEFRPYFRVEVAGVVPAPPSPLPLPEDEAVETSSDEGEAEAPVPAQMDEGVDADMAASAARRGLFGR